MDDRPAAQSEGGDELLAEVRELLASQTGRAPDQITQEEIDLYLAELLAEADREDQDQHIVAAFQGQAERTPDHAALVADGATITYAELNARAHRLAHHLRTRGVSRAALVGTCLPRSIEQVIVMLAIWKVGATCMALDPADPVSHRARLLEKTRPGFLISLSALGPEPALPAGSRCEIVLLDEAGAQIASSASADPAACVSPLDGALVAWSGDSAVLVEHRALHARVAYAAALYESSAEDVVLHAAAPGSQGYLIELLGALLRGATVVVATPGGRAVDELVRDHAITHLHLAPTELARLVASAHPSTGDAVRCVVCEGEPLSLELAAELEKRHRAAIHSGHAPSVAGTVASRTHAATTRRYIAWGGAPAHDSVHLLDAALQEVPTGTRGEIVVGGSAIARCYVGDPHGTALDFLPDARPGRDGDRVVRTGDAGRLLEGGLLEVLGPLRREADARGARMDLCRVEQELSVHEDVMECFVVARPVLAGGVDLVAYVVRAAPVTAPVLESHLRDRLPARAIPRAYVWVPSLPLTQSGGVDERALAAIPVLDPEAAAACERRLSASPGMADVVVVASERQVDPAFLHVSDLLPPEAAEAKVQAKAPERVATAASGSGKLAVSDGGPLQTEPDAPVTLPDALRRAAAGPEGRGVLFIHTDGSETHRSYAEVLQSAQRILAGLRALDLAPGNPVVFQIERGPEFISALWACFLGGYVPVPVATAPSYTRSNATIQKLQAAWATLDRPLLLTTSALVESIRGVPAIVPLEGFRVAVVDELDRCEPSTTWHASRPEDVALLLLTSGSTGASKVVTLTHRNILAGAAGTAQLNGFTSEDVNLNWMPLDHVGSIVAHHAMLVYLGARQIHIETAAVLADPLRWLDWIDEHRATISWAPNFAFSLINARHEELRTRKWDLSSMRFIVNAGEAIVGKTVRRFIELLAPHRLPVTAMRPTFGMSETASGITMAAAAAEGDDPWSPVFVDLGLPIPGCSLRIVDDRGEVVPEEQVGRLQVRGASVMPGYFRNPTLNADLLSADGWFTTGDLGFLRAGSLTLTAREKDVIIVNGANYYSHEIEGIVEEVQGVLPSFVAACAVRTASSETDQLAVFFSSSAGGEEPPMDLIRQIRARVLERAGVNPHQVIPVAREAIPKTSIGKIQRSQLANRFAAGEFAPLLKRIDVGMRNANTLPAWFHHPVWVRREISGMSSDAGRGATIVLVDDLGVGHGVARRLREGGSRCITVEAGEAFGTRGPDDYQVAPGNPADHLRLCRAIAESGSTVGRLVHLWTHRAALGPLATTEEMMLAQRRGAHGLLFAVQAIAAAQGQEIAVDVLVASSFLARVATGDRVGPEHAPVLGVLRTVAQELPGWRARTVDLQVGAPEDDARRLHRELRALDAERDVAYRGGLRWVQRLETVDFEHAAVDPTPIARGGFYLVTGGLGGVGLELAKLLLSEHSARLLLVGRTPRPEGAAAAALASLASLSGSVAYAGVDVADGPGLRAAVSEAASRWSARLSGVFHLAGLARRKPLLEESAAGIDEVLRPKLAGSWLLHEILLEQDPRGLFVHFSSVNGFFGGTGAVAYSAANAFVDGFSEHLAGTSSVRSRCLVWSRWDDVGMSAGAGGKEAARAQGFYGLSAEQALMSLKVGLRRRVSPLFVGLDASKPNVRRLLVGNAAESSPRLHACVPADLAADARTASLASSAVDRFGTAAALELVRVESFPRSADGSVDRDALAARLSMSSTRSKRVGPRNEEERRLVAIWQTLLRLPEDSFGVTDDFFQLGGHSLLAVRLLGELAKSFDRPLQVSALFEGAATIERLASLLRQDDAPAEEPLALAIQTGGAPPAWFFVHPISGHALGYLELSRALGATVPFYGLQAPGLERDTEPCSSIEELARRYVRAARSIQPHGPYLLGGYSFGGVIAAEMARELLLAGERLVALVLVDAPVKAPRETAAMNVTTLLGIFLDDLARMFGRRPPRMPEGLAELAVEAQIEAALEHARVADRLPPGLDVARVRRYFGVFRANLSAWQRHEPVALDAAATLVHSAARSEHARREHEAGWRALLAGGVEIVEAPGDHFSMLQSPHVTQLARIISRR